jgi:hypothetical protein
MANRAAAAVSASLFAVSLATAAPKTASTAELVLRPVRTLVYDLAITIGNVRKTPREGRSAPTYIPRRTSNAAGPATRPAGGAETSSPAAMEAKGSIVADIMAATADGGLVIDVVEAATGRNRPKVRVTVTGEGAVGFDPKDAMNVTQEEIALARWLARGFYGEHPADPGTEWTNDQSGNGVSGTEHYRVIGVAAQRITLGYAMEEKSAGNASYGETREGSLVYDREFVVPLTVSYQGQTRRELFGAFDTTTTSVTLTLKSDSFAKKK